MRHLGEGGREGGGVAHERKRERESTRERERGGGVLHTRERLRETARERERERWEGVAHERERERERGGRERERERDAYRQIGGVQRRGRSVILF